MVTFFVFVHIFTLQQVFSLGPNTSDAATQSVQPGEETNSVVPRKRTVAFVYNPIKTYQETQYHIHSHPPSTANEGLDQLGKDEYQKVIQERVRLLENSLNHLKVQNISKWDQPTILNIIIEADQRLNDLKSLNLQTLPHHIQSQIEKLEQSVENIKTTVFALVQHKEDPARFQKTAVPENYTGRGSLEKWINSLKEDLESFDGNHISGVDRQKIIQEFVHQMEEILALQKKLGQKNITKEVLTKVHMLRDTVNTLETTLKTNIEGASDNEGNKLTKTPIGHDVQQDHQLTVITEWVNNLENYFKELESHKIEIDQLMISQLSIQILERIKNLGIQTIPLYLQNKITQLKERIKRVGYDVSVNVHIHNKPDFTNFTKPYKLPVLVVDDNSEIDTRQIVKLEHLLEVLKTQLSFQSGTTNLKQIKIQADSILDELKSLKVINFTYEFQKRVEKLKEDISKIKRRVDLAITINNEFDVLDKKPNNNDSIKTAELLIIRLETELAMLRNQLDSKPTELVLMQVDGQAEEIIKELNHLEGIEYVFTALKSEIQRLLLNVNDLRFKIKEISHRLNIENNTSLTGIKSDSDIEDIINEFENDIKILRNLPMKEQDSFSLMHIILQVHQISVELHLLHDNNMQDHLRLKIENLEKIIHSFMDEVKFYFMSTKINHTKYEDSNEEVVIDGKSNEETSFNEELDLSTKKITKWINEIENDLKQLESRRVSEKDQFIVQQLISRTNLIITIARKWGFKKLPYNLENEINQLKERLQIVMVKTNLTKTNNNTASNGNNNKFEMQINYYENLLETLKQQLSLQQHPSLTTLTEIELRIHLILDNLRLLKVNNVDDNFQIRVQKLEEEVYSFQNRVEFVIKKSLDTTKYSRNEENFKKAESLISKLETELEILRNQINSKRSALFLTQVEARAHEIVAELKQLEVVGNTVITLQDKIQKLYLNVNNLISETQLMIRQSKIDSTSENSIQDSLNNLENELKNLKNRFSKDKDQKSLIEISLQGQRISVKLEMLAKENTKVYLQKEIEYLHKKVDSFLVEVKSKFMNHITNESKIVKTDQPENSIDTTTVEEQIIRIEHDLESISSQLTDEDDLFILMQIDIQLHRMLVNLKILGTKVNYNYLSKIKNLEHKVESIAVEVDSKILIHQAIIDEASKHPQKPAIIVNLQVIEEQIQTFEHDLDHLRSVIDKEEDLMSLIYLYFQVDWLLGELQRIVSIKIPNNLPIKVKKLTQITKTIHNKLNHLVTTTHIVIPTEREQPQKTAKTEIKIDSNAFEIRVQELLEELMNFKEQLSSKQDHFTIKIMHVEIQRILVELKRIKTNTIPDKLRKKIEQIIQTARDLQKTVEELSIPKKTDSKLEKIVGRRVKNLMTLLESSKNILLYKQDQSSVIQIYITINQILIEVNQLKDKNVSDELKNNIRILQENTNNLKDTIASHVKSKILDPMEQLINDLLLKIDSIKISRLALITRAKVKDIKQDLIALKGQIKMLTNYDLIKEIQQRISEIVVRLDDLKSSHLSSVFDNTITKLSNGLKVVLHVKSK